MEYGFGNNRRHIDVSKLTEILDKKQPVLSVALLGMHAQTGCDFTSCFFGKGKVKHFKKMESDISHVFGNADIIF